VRHALPFRPAEQEAVRHRAAAALPVGLHPSRPIRYVSGLICRSDAMRLSFAPLGFLTLLAACASGAGVDPVGVPLRMATAGIGDVVLANDHLLLDDGSRVPVERLAEGVYALPTRPVRLPNGTDFCSGQPVAYLTLHRTEDGLIAMNAGDWAAPPEPPPAGIVESEGACATFTYRIS
jgi:hypothetical protein